MLKPYYLNTSIWLDFLENRDEPNIPKGTWAKNLIKNIKKQKGEIIYSDLNMIELENAGYSIYEIEELFKSLNLNLTHVEATKKQVGKGRDISSKRKIPKGDAIHALIARDHNAILVTLDEHFKSLTDITIPNHPKDLL